MKKIAAAVLALPIASLAWQAYTHSLRWGTSDPCGMAAERFRRGVSMIGREPLERGPIFAQEPRQSVRSMLGLAVGMRAAQASRYQPAYGNVC